MSGLKQSFILGLEEPRKKIFFGKNGAREKKQVGNRDSSSSKKDPRWRPFPNVIRGVWCSLDVLLESMLPNSQLLAVRATTMELINNCSSIPTQA
jgi:hypothetical protein